jgi:hypothetical protein
MQSHQISYRETGFVSKLICNLFGGNKQLKAFYGNSPKIDGFKTQLLAKQKSFTQDQRSVLVSALIKQYGTLSLKKTV